MTGGAFFSFGNKGLIPETKVIEGLSPKGACPLDITKADFRGFGVFK